MDLNRHSRAVCSLVTEAGRAGNSRARAVCSRRATTAHRGGSPRAHRRLAADTGHLRLPLRNLRRGTAARPDLGLCVASVGRLLARVTFRRLSSERVQDALIHLSETIRLLCSPLLFFTFPASVAAPQADLNDRKKIFRALTLRSHPDKGGDPEVFKWIQDRRGSFLK